METDFSPVLKDTPLSKAHSVSLHKSKILRLFLSYLNNLNWQRQKKKKKSYNVALTAASRQTSTTHGCRFACFGLCVCVDRHQDGINNKSYFQLLVLFLSPIHTSLSSTQLSSTDAISPSSLFQQKSLTSICQGLCITENASQLSQMGNLGVLLVHKDLC